MTHGEWNHVTRDVVELLRELSREAAPPSTARARLRAVEAAHPGHRLRLVWEEEDYTGTWHYDALVELPGDATLVIGYCPDRGLPFIARAASRWSEDDLLRVDGEPLKIQAALEHLEIAHDPTLCARLVDGMILTQFMARLPADALEVSDAELQRGLDAFRVREGLHRAEDAARWLAARGISHEALEVEIEASERINKLREREVGAEVAAYFEAHAADFAQARVTTVELHDERLAADLRARLSEGQELLAALEAFAPGQLGEIALLRSVRRGELPAAICDAVFAAPLGVWRGPVVAGGAATLLRVSWRDEGELDDSVRSQIVARLFDAWLRSQREAAKVEWFWGRAQ